MKSKEELDQIAFRVREHVIKMATDGGCFIGASLSCVDLLVFLYNNYLQINKSNLNTPERDYLFLSKGHDVPALYGTLAEKGILDPARLQNHLKTTDYIYWHPNVNVPGVEFHSGSLGHLLAVAAGVAYDCKLRNQNNKVVVILGDGELNEGSIWEACLVAAAHKLDNLVAVVDRNKFQANFQTEDLIPIEPIDKKFEAFGWSAAVCDGHSFDELNKVFSSLPNKKDSPSVIVANTIRGKGLPSIESISDRWFCNFSHEEIELLLKELYSQQETKLTSNILMVR